MAAILILEDDLDVANQWYLALQAWGHEVTHAATYEEAIIEYEAKLFDVLVVDLFIRLQDEDQIAKNGGVTLLSKPPIDERYRKRTLHRIVVTGSFLATDPAGSMGLMLATLGVSMVLAKPIHSALLVSKIDRILRDASESSASDNWS